MSNLNIDGQGFVDLAPSSHVASDVQFVFHAPGRITIGDYCTIGAGVKFVCSGGDVVIGDWVTLHDRCLVLSGQFVNIGQHCWFGQNSIIDGTGGVTIGRGVRVGMYSQIWSHVAAGEQIEGCTLYGERPVVLEDDVWLVGSCIVASGVTIGKRTVALIGSNITKSCEENSVLAGIPAIPKSNLSFYKKIDLNEKWLLLIGWVGEIAETLGLNVNLDNQSHQVTLSKKTIENPESIIFVKDSSHAAILRSSLRNTTICCVEDKSYNKSLTSIEYKVLKQLAGNKARFSAI